MKPQRKVKSNKNIQNLKKNRETKQTTRPPPKETVHLGGTLLIECEMLRGKGEVGLPCRVTLGCFGWVFCCLTIGFLTWLEIYTPRN